MNWRSSTTGTSLPMRAAFISKLAPDCVPVMLANSELEPSMMLPPAFKVMRPVLVTRRDSTISPPETRFMLPTALNTTPSLIWMLPLRACKSTVLAEKLWLISRSPVSKIMFRCPEPLMASAVSAMVPPAGS